ncbi:hypothetical protein GCM10009552_18470 [Rothia nasimurium]
MMAATSNCPADTSGDQNTCYMTNLDQALKAVTNLQTAGVEYFMLPSATTAETELMASAIEARGGKFLTMERWTFEDAVNKGAGTFSCDSYTANRINALLVPLKKQHPDSFFGLELKDEPPSSTHSNLGSMVACVRAQPLLSDLKIFVNLVPVNANDASLNGPKSPEDIPDALKPIDIGIDCNSNTLVDRTKFNAMVARYTDHVISALDKIKPDYIAYDIYPFNAALDSCTTAREQLMTANASIIAQQANVRGVIPIAFLQNVQQAVPTGSPYDPRHASFHELRWFAAWFYAFGGRGTANFLSHDWEQYFGMLDASNNPRDIAIEQQSVFGFTHQVQDALGGYTYVDFVAPWLGVPTAAVVGWLPAQNIMASEFTNPDNGSNIVVFVNRNNGPTPITLVGLNKWRTKIEKLNFWTGLWETVGQSTNAISVDFGDMPAAVYRLTD